MFLFIVMECVQMEFTKTDLNRTLYVKPEWLEKNRKWYQVNADGKTLGRLAVEIAKKLTWKGKAHYADFWDAGDFVVVQNVAKMNITGNNKKEQKIYYSYSGYKGNVKSINLGNLLKKDPEKVLWFAVRGMLPKNKLRDMRMKRMKTFVQTSVKYDYLHPEVMLND